MSRWTTEVQRAIQFLRSEHSHTDAAWNHGFRTSAFPNTSAIIFDQLANGDTVCGDVQSKVKRSDRLGFNLNVRYQQFEAQDWALEGVAPDTIQQVLSLGALPYDEDSVWVGLGFRYSM